MIHDPTGGARREVPFELRPFRPAPWLPGAHLQTLGGRVLRPSPDPGLRRERLETPDGDVLLLDVGPEPRVQAPVALVLHGLEGSTERNYARLTLDQLHRRGLRPVGLNFRSCGGEPNRLARAYHAGDTEDLAFVLGRLAERFPDRPVGVIGFSLGGNVLLKYLGERGDEARKTIAAAVAVSVPFDLAAGARALETGPMGRLYTLYFLRKLRRKVAAKAPLLTPPVDAQAARLARTLRAYDDALTAPLHGFRDATDYYRRSSSLPYLPSVRVPTLLLQARDDPFLPDALPLREAEANPFLVPGFTRGGGHLGFVEGPHPGAPSFWCEEEGTRFLSERVANTL